MRRAVLLSLLVLTGCGAEIQPGRQAVPGAASTVHPDDAWDVFPVDRKPRPLILLDPLPEPAMRPAPVNPPAVPATMPVTLPDGPAELPTITASQASTAMKGSGPIVEVPVELGSAVFDTDRGKVTLPVWRFRASPVVEWPALDPSVFWKPGKIRKVAWEAPPAKTDGLRLTVSLIYSPEPCPGESAPPEFRGVASESPTSVVVSATSANRRCAPGETRVGQFEITLAQPLGARVLLTGSGSPIPVG